METYQVDLTLEEIELIEHAVMTYRNVNVEQLKTETNEGVKQMIVERLDRDNVTTASLIGKLNKA